MRKDLLQLQAMLAELQKPTPHVLVKANLLEKAGGKSTILRYTGRFSLKAEQKPAEVLIGFDRAQRHPLLPLHHHFPASRPRIP